MHFIPQQVLLQYAETTLKRAGILRTHSASLET